MTLKALYILLSVSSVCIAIPVANFKTPDVPHILVVISEKQHLPQLKPTEVPKTTVKNDISVFKHVGKPWQDVFIVPQYQQQDLQKVQNGFMTQTEPVTDRITDSAHLKSGWKNDIAIKNQSVTDSNDENKSKNSKTNNEVAKSTSESETNKDEMLEPAESGWRNSMIGSGLGLGLGSVYGSGSSYGISSGNNYGSGNSYSGWRNGFSGGSGFSGPSGWRNGASNSGSSWSNGGSYGSVGTFGWRGK